MGSPGPEDSCSRTTPRTDTESTAGTGLGAAGSSPHAADASQSNAIWPAATRHRVLDRETFCGSMSTVYLTVVAG